MPSFGNSAFLIGIGLVPSLIWLSFYLRRDCHPEPKYMLAKAFLMGIIISPLAILFQLAFAELGQWFYPETFNQTSYSFFLWAAFVEEFLKFYAIRLVILNSPEFDEPVDAMIYMITAALGFAAIENILTLFTTVPLSGIDEGIKTLVLRFAGATLLHALASALTGYFIAMSWFFKEHEKKLIVFGLVIATLFHSVFNILIASSKDASNPIIGLVYTTFLLIVMAFLVSILFDKMRERSKTFTNNNG